MDHRLNEREADETEDLLDAVPWADCPIYPSGAAASPTPYSYKRSS